MQEYINDKKLEFNHQIVKVFLDSEEIILKIKSMRYEFNLDGKGNNKSTLNHISR